MGNEFPDLKCPVCGSKDIATDGDHETFFACLECEFEANCQFWDRIVGREDAAELVEALKLAKEELKWCITYHGMSTGVCDALGKIDAALAKWGK